MSTTISNPSFLLGLYFLAVNEVSLHIQQGDVYIRYIDRTSSDCLIDNHLILASSDQNFLSYTTKLLHHVFITNKALFY